MFFPADPIETARSSACTLRSAFGAALPRGDGMAASTALATVRPPQSYEQLVSPPWRCHRVTPRAAGPRAALPLRVAWSMRAEVCEAGV